MRRKIVDFGGVQGSPCSHYEFFCEIWRVVHGLDSSETFDCSMHADLFCSSCQQLCFTCFVRFEIQDWIKCADHVLLPTYYCVYHGCAWLADDFPALSLYYGIGFCVHAPTSLLKRRVRCESFAGLSVCCDFKSCRRQLAPLWCDCRYELTLGQIDDAVYLSYT